MSTKQLGSLGYLVMGVLTAAFWLLHPSAADPGAPHDAAYWAAVQSQRYIAVNAMFVIVLVLCLFGLTTVFAVQRKQAGTLGAVGYVLASVGTAVFIGAGVFQAFVAPTLAANEATRVLLDAEGPLLGHALAPVFGGAGIAFLAGYVVFSIATFRAAIYPRASAAMVALGAPILGLSPLMPLPARIAGCLAFGLGCAWQGWVGWRTGEAVVS